MFRKKDTKGAAGKEDEGTNSGSFMGDADEDEVAAAMAQAEEESEDDDDTDDLRSEQSHQESFEVKATLVPDSGDHKEAYHGVKLFFTNRFEEADAFFQAKKQTVPIHSTAYACIGFLKAMLTMEPEDITDAQNRLNDASKLAWQHAGYEGTLSKISRLVTWSKATAPAQAQLSARINVAETRLIGSVLVLLGESVTALIRAGIGFKWAHSRYEELFKQIQSDDGKGVPVNASDLGGIYYGVGTFNLMLSILPRRLIRLVKVFGFESSRAKGLGALNLCFNLGDQYGGGLRCPMSAIMLLAYHTLTSAFFAVPEELPMHIAKSEEVLAKVMIEFPNSAIFLYISGRLERLKGNSAAAIDRFNDCLATQADWVQLQHLCCYELGWTYFALGEWDRARGYWVRLMEESKWSKAFYTYMIAVCDAMVGKYDEAAKGMQATQELSKRKIGGKVLPIEQYLHRKVKDYSLTTTAGLRSAVASMLAWELVYLWNFVQGLPTPRVAEGLADVEKAAARLKEEEKAGTVTPELCSGLEGILAALKGTFLLNLGKFPEALAAMRQCAGMGIHATEKWVYPHVQYDIGVMLITSVSGAVASTRYATLGAAFQASGEGSPYERCAKAHAAFKAVSAVKQDYNFEIRLKFKLQAAAEHAKRSLKAHRTGAA